MTEEQVRELIEYVLQVAPWMWAMAKREVLLDAIRFGILTLIAASAAVLLVSRGISAYHLREEGIAVLLFIAGIVSGLLTVIFGLVLLGYIVNPDLRALRVIIKLAGGAL